ncbi:MAG: MobB mobilization protein [Betaproteobacteria bacterium]|nr:MobB mobilization protein [Betaproteobacteria bacterium]
MARELDTVVNVRLTMEEKNHLRADADLAALSVSELARRRLMGYPIVAHADAILIKELRRIGGLLKLVHSESGGAYSDATAAALREVRNAIERVAR